MTRVLRSVYAFVACVAVATTDSARGEPRAIDAEVIWQISGELCEPETVLVLPDSTLLISNVCEFNKLASGYLSLLGPDGRAIRWRAVTNLDSPLGMAMRDARIYVVDRNRIKVFHWPTFEPLTTIELPTKVANDVAVARDGTLYVTDSAAGSVIKRTPAGDISALAKGFNFENANGIHLSGSGLYIGGQRLWRFDLETEALTTIGPPLLGDIDGIELEADGTLQIVPVGGPLIRYRNATEIEVHAASGISGTNHGYSAELGVVYIPTGFDNTVVAVRVRPPR